METTKSYMYSAIRNGSSKSVNKHVHEKKNRGDERRYSDRLTLFLHVLYN